MSSAVSTARARGLWTMRFTFSPRRCVGGPNLADRGCAAADREPDPVAGSGEIVRGDGAPDLVGGQGGSLLVGRGQDDGEMRRSLGVQKSHCVGVADGLAQTLRDLAQQPFKLDVAELLVNVLGVVKRDAQDRG